MGHSYGTLLLWDTLVGHPSSRTFSDTLVGRSCRSPATCRVYTSMFSRSPRGTAHRKPAHTPIPMSTADIHLYYHKLRNSQPHDSLCLPRKLFRVHVLTRTKVRRLPTKSDNIISCELQQSTTPHVWNGFDPF